jgi:hypothetical protein
MELCSLVRTLATDQDGTTAGPIHGSLAIQRRLNKWAPPPGVADAVLDNMCESVLIRPWNSHIFVCPALLTAKWRKQLRKVADFIVTIPVGSSLWPHDMCEPIVFAICSNVPLL